MKFVINLDPRKNQITNIVIFHCIIVWSWLMVWYITKVYCFRVPQFSQGRYMNGRSSLRRPQEKLQYIFRGNHLIYLQFIQTFFLTCPSKISALCVFSSCYMTYMTRENLDLFAPYLNMDIRTKQVYIKRNSVHHLLDLQNVTKVTLKIHVMLARHLAETSFWPKPVFVQNTM